MYTFQLTTNLTQDRGSDLGLSSGTIRAAECGTGTLTGEAEAGVMGHMTLAGHMGMSSHHRVSTLERAVAGDGVQESERLAKLEMSSYLTGKICKRN